MLHTEKPDLGLHSRVNLPWLGFKGRNRLFLIIFSILIDFNFYSVLRLCEIGISGRYFEFLQNFFPEKVVYYYNFLCIQTCKVFSHICSKFVSESREVSVWAALKNCKTATLIATEYVGLNCIKVYAHIAWACILHRNTYVYPLSKSFVCAESINGWAWIIRGVYFQINSINWL